MQDTLNKIQAENYRRVTASTFGHLAPKPNNKYIGWILFALTSFGETIFIDFVFENLNESPWFNNDALDLISKYTNNLPKEKEYGVFKWVGTYKKFKNGNFKFTGKIKEIDLNN